MENLKNIQPVEDFNWDSYEKGETYGDVSDWILLISAGGLLMCYFVFERETVRSFPAF